MPRKRILFISHEASLTGAPILLLNLIELVHKYNEFDISILCVRDGQLRKEFSRFGRCMVLKNEDMYREKSAVRRVVNKLSFVKRLIAAIPLWKGADLVFNNTIGNGKVLKFYSRHKRLPVFSYVHELEQSIRHAAANGEAQLTFEYSEKIVSPSVFNTRVLNQVFNVPEQQLSVLHYFIRTQLDNAEMANLQKAKAEAKARWCASYGLDPGTRLVLGMGTFDKRKAVDYFIETAEQLKGQPVCFFWIGMSKEPGFFKEMEDYVVMNNVSNFHYVGARPHDLHNYLPFDIFFLSSREDPYPLVVLEAASVQVPTICFDGSGGIVDFISADTGWIVPGFDRAAAADMIIAASNEVIAEKGLHAQQRVLGWHFDEGAIYQSFLKTTGLIPA